MLQLKPGQKKHSTDPFAFCDQILPAPWRVSTNLGWSLDLAPHWAPSKNQVGIDRQTLRHLGLLSPMGGAGREGRADRGNRGEIGGNPHVWWAEKYGNIRRLIAGKIIEVNLWKASSHVWLPERNQDSGKSEKSLIFFFADSKDMCLRWMGPLEEHHPKSNSCHTKTFTSILWRFVLTKLTHLVHLQIFLVPWDVSAAKCWKEWATACSRRAFRRALAVDFSRISWRPSTASEADVMCQHDHFSGGSPYPHPPKSAQKNADKSSTKPWFLGAV